MFAAIVCCLRATVRCSETNSFAGFFSVFGCCFTVTLATCTLSLTSLTLCGLVVTCTFGSKIIVSSKGIKILFSNDF